jgi:hypothetical protein
MHSSNLSHGTGHAGTGVPESIVDSGAVRKTVKETVEKVGKIVGQVLTGCFPNSFAITF